MISHITYNLKDINPPTAGAGDNSPAENLETIKKGTDNSKKK